MRQYREDQIAHYENRIIELKRQIYNAKKAGLACNHQEKSLRIQEACLERVRVAK